MGAAAHRGAVPIPRPRSLEDQGHAVLWDRVTCCRSAPGIQLQPARPPESVRASSRLPHPLLQAALRASLGIGIRSRCCCGLRSPGIAPTVLSGLCFRHSGPSSSPSSPPRVLSCLRSLSPLFPSPPFPDLLARTTLRQPPATLPPSRPRGWFLPWHLQRLVCLLASCLCPRCRVRSPSGTPST